MIVFCENNSINLLKVAEDVGDIDLFILNKYRMNGVIPLKQKCYTLNMKVSKCKYLKKFNSIVIYESCDKNILNLVKEDILSKFSKGCKNYYVLEEANNMVLKKVLDGGNAIENN